MSSPNRFLLSGAQQEAAKHYLWIAIGVAVALLPGFVSGRLRVIAILFAVGFGLLAAASVKALLTKCWLELEGDAIVYLRTIAGRLVERQRVEAATEVRCTKLRTTPRSEVEVFEIVVAGKGQLRWLAYGRGPAEHDAAAARELLERRGR